MQMTTSSTPRPGDSRPNPTVFGIVTPTLNAEAYLEATLESIWSQASDAIAIDHVLVDGGSTDRTIEIAERYPTRVVVSRDQSRPLDGRGLHRWIPQRRR
jgi:glycosyltransferase involved in cell wall biosynthesis